MEKIHTRKLSLSDQQKADTYPATLSTETPVLRGDFYEVLVHNEQSIDVSRFPLPVIESHDSSKVNIGIAENPRIEGGKLRADIRLGNSARAMEIKADIEGGIINGLSVGYRWLDYEEERRGNEDYIIVKRFMPVELSIVSVPADENAGFFRGINVNTAEKIEETKQPVTAMQIRKMAEQYGVLDADKAALDLVDKGLSKDEVDRELFKRAKHELWVQRDEQTGTLSGIDPYGYGHEQNLVRAFSDSLAIRAGIPINQPHVAANDFRGLGLAEMARTLLQSNGVYDSTGRPENIIKRAMSTSDFPNVLADVTNKIMQHAYTVQQATFDPWTSRRLAGLYRDVNIVNLSEMPALQQVYEWGEYKHGPIGDNKETVKMAKYGRIFSISWESLAKDDVNAFSDLMSAFGREARRTEADLIYTAMTSNPNLSDGTAFFSTTRGNLAASGSAISIASLDAARAAMRKYKGLGGQQYIDSIPRILLVPVALETTAQQIVSQITPAKNADVRPQWVGDLQVVADPRLDEVSETAWYLFANPSQVEGFVRVYMDDNPVMLEQREGFETDGFDIKCRLVMGAGAVDWRSAYKNPGI